MTDIIRCVPLDLMLERDSYAVQLTDLSSSLRTMEAFIRFEKKQGLEPVENVLFGSRIYFSSGQIKGETPAFWQSSLFHSPVGIQFKVPSKFHDIIAFPKTIFPFGGSAHTSMCQDPTHRRYFMCSKWKGETHRDAHLVESAGNMYCSKT